MDNEYNWVKEAAERTVNTAAIEKAFMDQAYGFVSDKAAALFKDPFRLGFEIVHKNDKATRMTANFAFRVGSTILYAPVFFINGEIKGADMLYRGDVKRFVPLEGWAEFLTEQKHNAQGEITPAQLASNQRPASTDLQSLAYPQGMSKGAAADMKPLDEMLEHCLLSSSCPQILPDMIANEGPDSLEKLASLIEDSQLASIYMAENYTEEQLVPEQAWLEAMEEDVVKSASAVEDATRNGVENGLLLYTDITPGMSKEAADGVFKYGYGFDDNRPLPEHTKVYIDDADTIDTSISEPGLANVISDGEATFEALVMRGGWDTEASQFITGSGGTKSCYAEPAIAGPDDDLCWRVFHTSKGEVSDMLRRDIFGKRIAGNDGCCFQNVDDADIPFVKADKVKTGQYYVAVHKPSLSCSAPLVITHKRTTKGCTTLDLSVGYTCGSSYKLFYKADGTPDKDLKHINDDIVFLKIKAKKDKEGQILNTWDTRVGGPADMNAWLLTSSGDVVKAASVTYEQGLFHIRMDGAWTNDLTRREFITKMAAQLGTSTIHAEAVAARAVARRSVDISLGYTHMAKAAYATSIIDSEIDTETTNDVFGVAQDSPSVQVLNTTTPQISVPEQHIGDRQEHFMGSLAESAIDAGLPGDALQTMSPEDLAGAATKLQLPHVFDHGVVGQLTERVYDSVAQVQKYLPKIESGLDHTGRVLFLLRYKPTDFEEAYGQDDMEEMEQELASVFKSTGAMVLRLLRKSKQEKFSPQSNA